MSATANPGATLVAPVHPFDTAALAAYLRDHLGDPARDLVVEQFQGGQSNPTYRVTTASGATCCDASRRASCCRPRTRSTASTA